MPNNRYQFDCGECDFGVVESVLLDFVNKVEAHHKQCVLNRDKRPLLEKAREWIESEKDVGLLGSFNKICVKCGGETTDYKDIHEDCVDLRIKKVGLLHDI